VRPEIVEGKQEDTMVTATQWTGTATCAWVESQALLDRVLQPYEDILVAAVSAAGAGHVLDIGCGTGSTTRALARLLGHAGRCLGNDISEQMIEAARVLAEREGSRASFICADAQTHAFEPAAFDMIVSRFGTMFFDDSVLAFANLRRAAKSNGELQFIAWRGPQENPFMTAAERAAAPLLPNLPARKPDEAGQFAFADASRVRAILEKSGWREIDLKPIDVPCTLPESELAGYATRFGPVGRALQEADAQVRAQVAPVVRAAFEPFVVGAEARFVGACWLVSARNV
jgi:ubiquinone/menaquinone biosynthesis C-methylase UbiE